MSTQKEAKERKPKLSKESEADSTRVKTREDAIGEERRRTLPVQNLCAEATDDSSP